MTHLWLIHDLASGDVVLRPDVAYRDRSGHLWAVLDDSEIGCALCVDEPDVLTLVQIHDDSVLSCQEHGKLMSIAYLEIHDYSIQVGGFQRSGTDRTDDEMFLPASLSDKERAQIIAKLFDECLAEVDSHEDG